MQNTVGVGEYGFYFVIFNFTLIFNILLDLGITNFNNRNIAQSNQLLNKHFSGILYLKILLVFLYFAIIFFVALLAGYNNMQLKILGVLGLNQFLLSLILYFRSNISGLLYFKTDSILSVLDRLLMTVFCGILLWANPFEGPFKIQWFIYAQTLAYFLTATICFLLVVNHARFRKLNWNWPFFLMILKKSAPFALLFLLMAFYTWLNPVLIETILEDPVGNDEAGIYAMGYRLLDAATMIAFLFAGLLMPIFSKMIKLKEPIGEIVKLSFTLIITFAIIVVAGSVFYAHDIMALLYHSHIDEATSVFRFLMIGFIGTSITYIFGSLLTANGDLKQLNIIAAISVLINISLNLILVPHLLAIGSAIASFTTLVFTAIAQVILAQRIFRFKVNVRFLITLFIFAGIVFMLNFISSHLSIQLPGFSEQTVQIGKLVAVALISSIIAFGMKMVSLRSMLTIIKREH
ncbi:MAG: oligosaccharide flippase family protein [Bacteroidia bacterium]|nr:oligosaccharide flippase family protein [Bacteroidia bacterium]